MQTSKRSGKMRALWYAEEFDAHDSKIKELGKALHHAIDAGELSVQYQPLVDAQSGHVLCLEALARWWPGHGREAVPPTVFIPVAEQTGLIEKLGIQVLTTACREASAWPGIQLSVNVSAAQLRNPGFPEAVKQVLRNTNFPPERLELEITEGLLVQDPPLAARIMAELHAVGIRFSLDDFGTGFASIGFLRRFQFDKLKLDRSLVTEAETSDAARALLNASISLAKVLGMEVAAEGIETRLQSDLMVLAGCKLLQGWYFSAAVPAAEVPQLINQLRSHFADAA